jgi:hypothetical protein
MVNVLSPQPPNTPLGHIALSVAANSKAKEPPSRLVEQPLDRTSDEGVAPSPLPSPFLLLLPQPASSSSAGACTNNRKREDGEPSVRASPNQQRPSQPARRSRQHRLQDQDRDPHVSVAALNEQCMDSTSDDGVAPSPPSPFLLLLPQPASSLSAGACTNNRKREDGEPSVRASPNQRPSQPARRSRQHRLQVQDQEPQFMDSTSDDGVAPSLPSPFLLLLPQPASSSSAGACTNNRKREDGEPSVRASPNQRPSQPARRSRVEAKTKHDEVAKSFLLTHTNTQLGLHGIRRGA